MVDVDTVTRLRTGQGFIAALDQSGGSTPKALQGYGIEADAYGNDHEMFALIHAMRARIIASPCFSGEKVLGAILFERTMDGHVDGQPVPAALIERGIVPFLKIDQGLTDQADGVQRMKPIDGLPELLARAAALGVAGTKARSVINLANKDGIAAVVVQQFEVAQIVLAAGLVPIIEPEINIHSPERREADALLRDALLDALGALPDAQSVMLKLSLPAQAGLFDALVDHPRTLRVVALSGGFAREQACAELAKNRGIIASFSRALLQDLRHQMPNDAFDRALSSAVDTIHAASIAG